MYICMCIYYVHVYNTYLYNMLPINQGNSTLDTSLHKTSQNSLDHASNICHQKLEAWTSHPCKSHLSSMDSTLPVSINFKSPPFFGWLFETSPPSWVQSFWANCCNSKTWHFGGTNPLLKPTWIGGDLPRWFLPKKSRSIRPKQHSVNPFVGTCIVPWHGTPGWKPGGPGSIFFSKPNGFCRQHDSELRFFMVFLIKKDRSTCEPRLFFVQVLQIISISFGVGGHSSLVLGVSPTRTLKSSELTRSKEKNLPKQTEVKELKPSLPTFKQRALFNKKFGDSP